MTNKLLELEAATQHINDRWGDVEIDRGLASLRGRVARERRVARARNVLLVAAGIAMSLGAGFEYGRHGDSRADLAARGAPHAFDVLSFPDGTTATAIQVGTSLRVEEIGDTRVVSSLEAGSVRFEVRPDHERAFQVRIGSATVSVLGTIFELVRSDANVHVLVTRGRVRVDYALGVKVLGEGESGDFPVSGTLPLPALEASAVPEYSSAAEALPKVTPARKAVVATSWRALAKNGRVKEAYDAVRAVNPSQIRDAEELLLAADVARLSGHATDGVPYLERVLSEFAQDSRAPAAALSLGRILLAKDPIAAAARFQQAFKLAPTGVLAEDALAREAEAWSRGGAAGDAARAAREYAARYPGGAHAEQMRKLVDH